MQDCWVAFATSGDPNRPGLPEWVAYYSEADLALCLGAPADDGSVAPPAMVPT
jgi:carboxylesterase type B